MAFLRLCDNYIDHPKFRALSDRAFRLWHEALAHCRKYLTDGLISDAVVKDFRYYTKGAADQLLSGETPLWETVEGFGVKVHDYLDWNPSKDVEQKRLTESRLRTARWRDASPHASPHASSDAYVPVGIGTTSSDLQIKRDQDGRFDAFWSAYPKKVGKDAARKAFDKRRPDDDLLDRILDAIAQQARSEQWRKDGGQFIPNPATWLNQGRWQDEAQRQAPTPIGSARRWSWDDCPHEPNCGSAGKCIQQSEIDAEKARMRAS